MLIIPYWLQQDNGDADQGWRHRSHDQHWLWKSVFSQHSLHGECFDPAHACQQPALSLLYEDMLSIRILQKPTYIRHETSVLVCCICFNLNCASNLDVSCSFCLWTHPRKLWATNSALTDLGSLNTVFQLDIQVTNPAPTTDRASWALPACHPADVKYCCKDLFRCLSWYAPC